MDLKDKVILITGSTTGIGAAIAHKCISEGAKVIIHGRDKERAKQMCAKLGENAQYCLADLTKLSALDKLVHSALKHFGRLDSLVNNAGIYPRSSIEALTPQLYEKVMNVNFRAPLFLTQAAVKIFRQQKKGGTVVNIGSINAYCGEANMAVYAPSKGALMTMTRNLANELAAEKIRINLLNVGWTLTETEDALKQSQGFSKNWEKHLPKTYAPTGKLLRPEQIAKHVVFWASEKSAPATGQVYDVEQYPVIGRNLIYQIPLDIFPKSKKRK